jgi:phosphopantothenoylcysteine decarboxylase / phosphopantothenate---cysteine ligase
MNHRMWSHPATQANVETLRARGVAIVGPEEGELAEGESGLGRMSEPAAIAARIEDVLAGSPGDGSVLAGKRVVVSAGGTREPLDAVRFLGNRSSGRMGVALAAEARRRGADVTLLASNLAVPAPHGVEVVQAPTAADVEREALARVEADVLVMAAAVADYRPAAAREDKRPKDDSTWVVELQPTVDVARALGERKNGAVLVAFGAERGEDGLARKRGMLDSKNADLVVYNDVGREDIGFDSDDNEVVLVTRGGERRVAKAPKASIAAEILDEVERLLGAAAGEGRP